MLLGGPGWPRGRHEAADCPNCSPEQAPRGTASQPASKMSCTFGVTADGLFQRFCLGWRPDELT
jgi:hypothetical protein